MTEAERQRALAVLCIEISLTLEKWFHAMPREDRWRMGEKRAAVEKALADESEPARG